MCDVNLLHGNGAQHSWYAAQLVDPGITHRSFRTREPKEGLDALLFKYPELTPEGPLQLTIRVDLVLMGFEVFRVWGGKLKATNNVPLLRHVVPHRFHELLASS